jgi:capsid protein
VGRAARQGARAARRRRSHRGLAPGDSPASNPTGGSGQGLRWWRPGTRDAAGDTLPDLSRQRAQIRELVRNNPIAGGAIDTNVDRTVGTGLALVAQPVREVLGWDDQKALEWKRMVQTEFSLWADSTARATGTASRTSTTSRA